MELLTQLLQALWAQDFETLANPSMIGMLYFCLLYTSPSPRDRTRSRMPSSA